MPERRLDITVPTTRGFHLPIWPRFGVRYVRDEAQSCHGEDTVAAKHGVRYGGRNIPPRIDFIVGGQLTNGRCNQK